MVTGKVGAGVGVGAGGGDGVGAGVGVETIAMDEAVSAELLSDWTLTVTIPVRLVVTGPLVPVIVPTTIDGGLKSNISHPTLNPSRRHLRPWRSLAPGRRPRTFSLNARFIVPLPETPANRQRALQPQVLSPNYGGKVNLRQLFSSFFRAIQDV
jgi:hypothetical protein